jgi:hypothetical protein
VRGQCHATAAFFLPGKTRYPLYRRNGWAPGPVWTGAENLVPTGIRSPDRPARSQSLYRLSYRPTIPNYTCTITNCVKQCWPLVSRQSSRWSSFVVTAQRTVLLLHSVLCCHCTAYCVVTAQPQFKLHCQQNITFPFATTGSAYLARRRRSPEERRHCDKLTTRNWALLCRNV